MRPEIPTFVYVIFNMADRTNVYLAHQKQAPVALYCTRKQTDQQRLLKVAKMRFFFIYIKLHFNNDKGLVIYSILYINGVNIVVILK